MPNKVVVNTANRTINWGMLQFNRLGTKFAGWTACQMIAELNLDFDLRITSDRGRLYVQFPFDKRRIIIITGKDYARQLARAGIVEFQLDAGHSAWEIKTILDALCSRKLADVKNILGSKGIALEVRGEFPREGLGVSAVSLVRSLGTEEMRKKLARETTHPLHLQRLAKDGAAQVRVGVIANPAAPDRVLAGLEKKGYSLSGNPRVGEAVEAAARAIGQEPLKALSNSPFLVVRLAVAANPFTPWEAVAGFLAQWPKESQSVGYQRDSWTRDEYDQVGYFSGAISGARNILKFHDMDREAILERLKGTNRELYDALTLPESVYYQIHLLPQCPRTNWQV